MGGIDDETNQQTGITCKCMLFTCATYMVSILFLQACLILVIL